MYVWLHQLTHLERLRRNPADAGCGALLSADGLSPAHPFQPHLQVAYGAVHDPGRALRPRPADPRAAPARRPYPARRVGAESAQGRRPGESLGRGGHRGHQESARVFASYHAGGRATNLRGVKEDWRLVNHYSFYHRPGVGQRPRPHQPLLSTVTGTWSPNSASRAWASRRRTIASCRSLHPSPSSGRPTGSTLHSWSGWRLFPSTRLLAS